MDRQCLRRYLQAVLRKLKKHLNDEDNEDIDKNYNEDIDIWPFSEVDVQYPEELCELHNDLLFLPQRVKIGQVVKVLL